MKIRVSKRKARNESKTRAGFTIIETILFVAIAAMVFTGVIVGTNGAIRRQRYKDTVQSFVDDLRDLYAIVENVEVLPYGSEETIYCKLNIYGESHTSITSENTGRGRSDCSVYGIITRVQMRSDASGEDKAGENIEAYWLIGIDQKMVDSSTATNDEAFLNQAYLSPYIEREDGAAGKSTPELVEATKSSLVWGAEIGFLCNSNKTPMGGPCKGQFTDPRDAAEANNYLYLMIYRSPLTNAVRTRVYYSDNRYAFFKEGDSSGKDKIVLGSGVGEFEAKDVKLCVIAGEGMSYGGGLRMVTISANASSEADIRLIEADAPENECNK